ncbi:CatA-like O-acetyltransferase [Methanomethylovorans sp.]|uniref:CatA-like O-acetyltransferase n=1 Tax=Methanomethylovorans sp. TaxID=2758717 RepID=UPI00351C5F8A
MFRTRISETGKKRNPYLTGGKYHEREGKLMMPFAVQVHHAFVDGIHIGKLADKLQRYLDEV